MNPSGYSRKIDITAIFEVKRKLGNESPCMIMVYSDKFALFSFLLHQLFWYLYHIIAVRCPTKEQGGLVIRDKIT